jgi:hypothetical protein
MEEDNGESSSEMYSGGTWSRIGREEAVVVEEEDA